MRWRVHQLPGGSWAVRHGDDYPDALFPEFMWREAFRYAEKKAMFDHLSVEGISL